MEKLNELAMEEWRPVVGFEGLYEISSHGRVKGLKRGKIRNTTPLPSGYVIIRLRKEGKYYTYYIHRLIGEAFLGLDVNDKWQVIMHLDDNKSNNVLSNLKVGTQKENMKCNVKGEWGVRWNKRMKSWTVCVRFKGERREGYRKNYDDAVALRDKWWSEMKD